MEPHAIASAEEPVAVSRARRKTGWMVLALIAGAAGIYGATHWLHSRRPETCYARGRAALKTGDRATVLRESRRLQETPEFEPQGRLLWGLWLAHNGRPEQALEELQHAAWADATAVEALTAAAGCYYALGQFVRSGEMARAALAKDGGAIDARRWLAVSYYDLGAMADAARELTRISKEAPQDPRCELSLGMIDKDNEQFGTAIEHFRASLARGLDGPDRADLLVDLAESLVKLSRFDEALETLGQCEPTAATRTLEAECEQSLGRLPKAEDLLQQALKLEPDYFRAWLNQGILFLFLERADEAASALQEAVRLAPHSSQAHFQLSQAYQRLGQPDQGAEQLRLMKASQALEREFSELNSLASQRPADTDVRYRTAVLARQLGKTQLAQMWLRSVLAIDPTHSQALAALAETDVSHP